MRHLEIFSQAVDIQDANERQRFIRQACGDDRELLEAVQQLFHSYDQSGNSQISTAGIRQVSDQELAQQLFQVFNKLIQPSSQELGNAATSEHDAFHTNMPTGTDAIIGPYRLLEKIGEGGFGEVFVAEQTEPLQRRVAVKIIKPGMDSREVIARFLAERQALALMDHPNIAQVFDGGTTPRGLPYFVMELVRGMSIVKYCDAARLTIEQRLVLFIDTCRALQHAHQKGIIHRDIKPSNVLVTLHDGRPVVKVIDFGVAKALNQRLTTITVYTRFSFMIGTPAYMSPEQAELSGLDVDTRSDIYSLGVLLYELMTGEPPFQLERFAKASMDEMRRIIREEEPQRPSIKISSLGPASSSLAMQRGIEAPRLLSVLRGDLDWIVMKSLSKDRSRRYDTANGLAADVKRFLDGEAVTARPPSWSYVTSRFVRRNKGLFISATMILSAVVLGSIISLLLAIWALQEQKIAQEQAGLAVLKSVEASEERDRAETAELAAIENLLKSRMAFTDLNLKSRQSGQQWESLNAIRESIDLAGQTGTIGEHKVALRSQVINALARVDLRPIRSIPVPNEANKFFTFSADFSKIAWKMRDGDQNFITLRQVNDSAKEEARVLYPFDTRTSFHDEVIPKLSPDGKFLTIGSGQHGILLWDLTRNQLIREMKAYFIVGGQHFSPDSRWLAVVERTVTNADDHVSIYRLPSGELHKTIEIPRGRQVVFSPDSTRIAFGGTDQVWICEVDNGNLIAEIRKPFGGWGPCLAWSPSGELIAVSRENQIDIWIIDDLIKGQRTKTPATQETPTMPICTLSGHESLVDRLMFHPLHEHLLVSSSWDNTTRFWNVFSGFEQLMVPQSRPNISADGKQIALTSASSAEIYEFLSGDACRWIWRGRSQQLVFDPQMSWLAVGTDRGARFWSIPSLTPIGTIGGRESFGLAWDEFKSGLLAGNSLGLFEIPIARDDESSLRLGPSKQLLTTSLSNFSHVYSSGDGRWVAAGELEDWSPLLLDRASGDVVRLHRGSRSQSISISPSGQWLAQHAGEAVYIRNLSTGQELANLNTSVASSGLTFSPDSESLLQVSNQGTRIVNFTNPGRECQLEKSIRMFSVPFANRQNMFVLPKGPGELNVLQGDQQENVCNLQYPDPPRLFAFAKFSPDDSLLAVTHETSAAVWNMQMVRDRLAELGLHWEGPAKSSSDASPAIEGVEIIPGDLEILQPFYAQVDSISRHDVAAVADELIQSGVTLPDLFYSRGWSRESLGDYARACEDMKQGLDTAPYAESWRKDLALCLMQSFRFLEAWEIYWPIGDPRNSYSAPFAFRQLCYIFATRPEVVPDSAEFRELLDQWLAALEGRDHASNFGLQVAGLSHDDKRALWEAAGMALYSFQESERALDILKQHARKQPARLDCNESHSVLAALYSKQGDLENAQRHLLEADNIYREHPTLNYSLLNLRFYEPLKQVARKSIQRLRDKQLLEDADSNRAASGKDQTIATEGRFDTVDLAMTAKVDFGRVLVSPANDKPEVTKLVEGNVLWWELTQPDQEILFELPVPGPGNYQLIARLVGSHYCGDFEVIGDLAQSNAVVSLYMPRDSLEKPALTILEDVDLGKFQASEYPANDERVVELDPETRWTIKPKFRSIGRNKKSAQFSLLVDEIRWIRME